MAKTNKQSTCVCFNEDKVNHLRELMSEVDFTARAKVHKAVGHPRRMLTLYLISKGEECEGELCVCDLAQTLDSPVPTVSQYLRILKDAGLIYDEQNHKFLIYKLTDMGRKVLGGLDDE
jgi:DNA-binding transcriptional ArsR family regulator